MLGIVPALFVTFDIIPATPFARRAGSWKSM
jgi:hypothetical protein